MAREDEFPYLDVEASQSGFGRLMGISQPAVVKLVEKGVLRRGGTYLDWIAAAFEQLRAQASGRRSEDGIDLTQELALTQRVDRQIEELTPAEKLGDLVPASLLESEFQAMVTVVRAELLNMAGKLKSHLDALYGTDSDTQQIREHIYTALNLLVSHAQPDGQGRCSLAQARRGQGPYRLA